MHVEMLFQDNFSSKLAIYLGFFPAKYELAFIRNYFCYESVINETGTLIGNKSEHILVLFVFLLFWLVAFNEFPETNKTKNYNVNLEELTYRLFL